MNTSNIPGIALTNRNLIKKDYFCRLFGRFKKGVRGGGWVGGGGRGGLTSDIRTRVVLFH